MCDHEKLFSKLGVTYLSHLTFQNLEAVQKRCARALRHGAIDREQKWLGAFYGPEIDAAISPPLDIRWTGAQVGYGVFSVSSIAPRTYIGEYTGLIRHRRYFADRKNSYCFDYHLGPFLIDAQDHGNHTRFINHSDTPNLTPLSVYWKGVLHIILIANHSISPDTQLTYNYGNDYWSNRNKIII